jgi:hypothetical protein
VTGQNDENEMGSSGEPVQTVLLLLHAPNWDNVDCVAGIGELNECRKKSMGTRIMLIAWLRFVC